MKCYFNIRQLAHSGNDANPESQTLPIFLTL